jgi:hypothetical protein
MRLRLKDHSSNLLIILLLVLTGCQRSEEKPSFQLADSTQRTGAEKRSLSEDFKAYWFDGKAELTSFSLSQERYGELRQGHAVHIFVTEDFLAEQQVKADRPLEDNIPVLKFNGVKKFVTGIYPYSIMTSSFSPLEIKTHALKISHSIQEWCGQAYMQLNNKEQFLVTSHSYFAREADELLRLNKTWVEDEFWNLIRIDPGELPTGEIDVIPAFEYLRLRHKPVSSYRADAILIQRDSVSIYQIEYPDLKRELAVYFSSRFPFEIEKWEETITGDQGEPSKTIARRITRIKTAYWNNNSNSDRFLRDSLGIDSTVVRRSPQKLQEAQSSAW